MQKVEQMRWGLLQLEQDVWSMSYYSSSRQTLWFLRPCLQISCIEAGVQCNHQQHQELYCQGSQKMLSIKGCVNLIFQCILSIPGRAKMPYAHEQTSFTRDTSLYASKRTSQLKHKTADICYKSFKRGFDSVLERFTLSFMIHCDMVLQTKVTRGW